MPVYGTIFLPRFRAKQIIRMCTLLSPPVWYSANCSHWKPLYYGKLRASFAQAGADISPYQTTGYYLLGNPYNTSFPMQVPDTLNNPNLKPSFGYGL